ncbi:ras GTPase-activating protein 1-like isoform X2 [Dysidea avara]|uniref:ras GTPase-activating protein 1-like isoform X2 n=1 Tax=Dysidea avara TaxID=196820 RepID=UPI00331E2415
MAHYGEDDGLPEPVYFKLENFQLPDYVLNSDPDQDLYSDDDSSVGDEDVELNLFAPPPESWYHGMISRHLAQSRMEDKNVYGCYLIRDSETRPGEYTLSFLSNTSIIHHFKINASCGDYYIGGRQFDSLEDLIGFYTNCSCILENECLKYPVSPPSYVPLYSLLRATASHNRNANSDELNISLNEVFVLKNRLSDDWGWGSSQLSGESGLIPLNIMEECPSTEPYYGKPWFYESVSREEAIQDLIDRGVLGSFLVRPSQGRGTQGRVYSMAVRTVDGVQRFLIDRDSYYYVCGNRQFTSLEHIIERYMKEEIVAGQTLIAPLPKRQVAPARPLPAVPPPVHSETSQRKHLNSFILSRGDNHPKDKSGYLDVKKGKKTGSKWKKKQYCVLKWEGQQLTIYDNAQSHRAKGLLDLSHCQILDVHPSIKPKCFVVAQKYLTEFNYCYLQSDSEDTIREWKSAIRSSIMRSTPENKKPLDYVQELWSLTLHVKDCKLAKAVPFYYCTVSIDEIPVACTRKASQMITNFDEQFNFMDLPRNLTALSVAVSSTRSRIAAKDNLIGKITISFKDLPDCQEYDQWHQLTPRAKGSLRVTAVFNHEVILPTREYSSLKEILLKDNLDVLESLVKVCKEHHAELASRLVHIYLDTDMIIDKLIKCNQRVIEQETNKGTLFRASSLATMLMDQYMKLKCLRYLHVILSGIIREVQESTESCELDPTMMDKDDSKDKNVERLQYFITTTVNLILNTAADCPPMMLVKSGQMTPLVKQEQLGDFYFFD